jgi:hypothetical protein
MILNIINIYNTIKYLLTHPQSCCHPGLGRRLPILGEWTETRIFQASGAQGYGNTFVKHH